jgi:hypothetical protein
VLQNSEAPKKNQIKFPPLPAHGFVEKIKVVSLWNFSHFGIAKLQEGETPCRLCLIKSPKICRAAF